MPNLNAGWSLAGTADGGAGHVVSPCWLELHGSWTMGRCGFGVWQNLNVPLTFAGVPHIITSPHDPVDEVNAKSLWGLHFID